MTAEQILAAEHERQAQHNGYSVADLRRTFDSLLHPGQNWKGEIFAVILRCDYHRVKSAVEFFTGSETYIQTRAGARLIFQEEMREREANGESCYAVRIPGYYASVCA